MAKLSEDPPSPVDAYESPATAPGAPPPPPGYAASQQYAAYPYGTPVRKTNVLAIVSLITSCAGVFIPLAYIAGIITGHIALSQIKTTGDAGHGMALAGVIVGYAMLAISLIVLVLYILFFVLIIGAASTAGSFNSSDFG